METTNTGRNTRSGTTIAIAVVLTLFRVWAGYLWFSELGWKAPWLGSGGFGCDAYLFNPPSGQQLHGLCDWMQREANYPTIGLYGDFVKNVVIANFGFFAWLTIFTETFITVSLVLGFLTRLGGLIGALWGLSLLIGLLSVPGESFFTYVPFILPPAFFAVIGARNQFSVDALLAKRYEKWASGNNPLGRLLKLATGARPGSAGVI